MHKIAVHSVPRSGSSWLGEIINSSEFVDYSYQPLFSYKFKSALNENSSIEEINNFYNNILISDDVFLTQELERKKGIKPTFEKINTTHVVYKEVRYHHILENLLQKDNKQKIVGLIRDPISVLRSWRNAPREFRADLGWKFKDEWKKANLKNEERKEDYFGYLKWKETAELFHSLQNRYPENVFIVDYENLKNHTSIIVNDLFEFLSLKVGTQTTKFISESKSTNVIGTYSVFKTVDNSSVSSCLEKDIIKEIKNDLIGTELWKYVSKI